MGVCVCACVGVIIQSIITRLFSFQHGCGRVKKRSRLLNLNLLRQRKRKVQFYLCLHHTLMLCDVYMCVNVYICIYTCTVRVYMPVNM